MSELIYIDTNVWLDYFFHRDKGLLSPCEISFRILSRSVLCEFRIILSDVLLFELEKFVPKDKLQQILFWLQPKLVLISTTTQDKKDSLKLAIHYPDSLHIILARKHYAILVSNDEQMRTFGAISSQDL